MSNGIIWYTRADGTEFMIAKVKTQYAVWANGRDTGYKFRSIKKAKEYCEYGY